MKAILSAVIFASMLFSGCRSQSQVKQNTGDLQAINLIFDKVEIQGVDTKQDLLYGYFFFDKDQFKLEKVRSDLVAQSYRFVELAKQDNGEFMLHVEKIEKHTRQSLYEREQKLRLLATKYNVSYDGFDMGATDPAKPLVSNESFATFLAAKKGEALFDLGVRLYDLEINDKAEFAFKACLKENIKPDTAAYKLGNTLIAENKIDEGISYLLKATTYNPRYLRAFFNLGATCYDNKQFQKSLQYYQQADKLKPNDNATIYGIAASYYALQQYDKSLERCRKALQLNKDNENAKQLLQMLKGKTN